MKSQSKSTNDMTSENKEKRMKTFVYMPILKPGQNLLSLG